MTKYKKIIAVVALAAMVFPFSDAFAQTAWEVRTITFPVIGAVTYWDDFGASRDGGARTHEGQDLMGRKMLPLVAAVDGTIRSVQSPQATWGYAVTIEDKDGYTYHYLHMNNDTPGTDNGAGTEMFAYAQDMSRGNKVVAGQLIGWMGDSGNAEGTTAHLHFEIRRPDRTPISPYGSLRAAKKITTPVVHPALANEILPFDQFGGGSFIAMGNVDADSQAEIAVGAGPGGGPHVKVINQDGTEVSNFFPYAKTFGGGVDVAMADVDGDGLAEIFTAPQSRGGPHIKVFKIDGTVVADFFAYDKNFTGGINITAADINSDGRAEIITAPARGGGSHVKAFRVDGSVVSEFFAYDPSFIGGVDVAAYAATANQPGMIVTSPNTGGGPHIKVFGTTGNLIHEFLAYDAGHRGGVRVAIANVKTGDLEPEILTAPLLGGPDFKLFELNGSAWVKDSEFETWWSGNWDAAAYINDAAVSVGPNSRRRASVREVNFTSSGDNNTGENWWDRYRNNAD